MPASDRENIGDLILLAQLVRAIERCDSAIEYALDTWDSQTFNHASEQRADLISRRNLLLEQAIRKES